jgi:hypothetical protein
MEMGRLMTIGYSQVASTLAVILAGAAIAVSLTSSGPQGVQGPKGSTGATGKSGSAANMNTLGFCWSDSTETFNNEVDNNIDGYPFMTGIYFDHPVELGNILFSCPTGETFVSVVPANK